MLTTNPFSELIEYIPAGVMQAYVVLMFIFVAGGTVLDMLHKKSAKYFFEHAKKSQKFAKRSVNGGEKASMAVKVLTNEVMAAAEFANPRRRISHLLLMYGFIVFVVTTAVMIFGYLGSKGSTPAIIPLLWHLGALAVAVGGYWFWFSIRVDVSAEGHPWYKIERNDVFILSLLATTTLALVWSFFQAVGAAVFADILFILFIIAATVLFATVFFSKFAHMFYKPAAAFNKRMIWADGSRERLPDIPDLTSAETKERFPDIPTYMGDNPPNMGLGIKSEPPHHY